MKNVLLIGYYGYGNYGDELMRQSIKEFLIEKNYRVMELLPKEKKKLNEYNRFNPFSVIKAIIKSDVVICGGGGVLQDKTSFKSFMYYYLLFKTALLFGKPLIFFGNSFGPFYNYASRILMKNLLESKKLYIFARDPVSYRYAKNFNKNSFLCTDPGIRKLGSIKVESSKESNKAVIIPRRIKNYVPLLLTLKSQGINEVVYVPFSPQDEVLAKRLSNISIKGLNSRFSNLIIEEISSSKIVVSERFHGSLVSAFLGKAFISVNDEKFRRFFNRYSSNNSHFAHDLFDASLKVKELVNPNIYKKMKEDAEEMYEKLEKLLVNL